MLVTCLAGARPNFMKIKPVVDAIEAIGIDVDLLHTGQHYDQAMSDVFFDSGGIQEETTALGVPCLTLRENTERPITITEGTNTLVGTDHDAILAATDRALAGRIAPRCPAPRDGHAGSRIAAIIEARLDDPAAPRPTNLVAQSAPSDGVAA